MKQWMKQSTQHVCGTEIGHCYRGTQTEKIYQINPFNN